MRRTAWARTLPMTRHFMDRDGVEWRVTEHRVHLPTAEGDHVYRYTLVFGGGGAEVTVTSEESRGELSDAELEELLDKAIR